MAPEFARIDAKIAKLQKEAKVLREKALKSAGVFGSNPYPGSKAAEHNQQRKQFEYRTTADWDGNALGVESTAPGKWKKWLKDVRGY